MQRSFNCVAGFVVCAAGLACASSQPSGVQRGPETVSRVFVPGGSGVEMTNDAGFGVKVIPAPMDSVWVVLPQVYEMLEIPEAGADVQQTMYGRNDFRARRLEGKRLSTFIDCGIGTTAVPNADNYQVTMSVTTRLTAGEDGGTFATTRVDANAKPRAVSGNPVHCPSMGTLEARVGDLIMWFLLNRERRNN